MATGPEMLISTLIKALKLEPEVDKIRQAIDGGLIDKFNNALEKINTFDERLERIEQKLGIEPGTNRHDFRRTIELYRDDPPQSASGTDRR